jgi:peroxiredoxin Q/BCP
MPTRSPARPAAAPPAPRAARSAKPAAASAATPAKKPAAKSTRPSGQEPKASPGVAVGDRAPDFSLPADDGKTYALKQLRGQRVVLYFYPRDSTPGCTTEACDFRDRQAAFTAAGAIVLGVSGDDLKSHARFRGKQSLNFPLLSDAGNAVAGAYGAFGDKVMYGRSLKGIIRSTFVIGPDGTLEAVWRPAKVPGHAETVLQTVTAAARPTPRA